MPDFNLLPYIYRPRKTPVEKLLEPHMKMMKTPRDLVVAGDFNIDKEADTFQPFRESLEEKVPRPPRLGLPPTLAGREHQSHIRE
jgi:hypothetical protein